MLNLANLDKILSRVPRLKLKFSLLRNLNRVIYHYLFLTSPKVAQLTLLSNYPLSKAIYIASALATSKTRVVSG